MRGFVHVATLLVTCVLAGCAPAADHAGITRAAEVCTVEEPPLVAACPAQLGAMVSACGPELAETAANVVVPALGGPPGRLVRALVQLILATRDNRGCLDASLRWLTCLIRERAAPAAAICEEPAVLEARPEGPICVRELPPEDCFPECPEGQAWNPTTEMCELVCADPTPYYNPNTQRCEACPPETPTYDPELRVCVGGCPGGTGAGGDAAYTAAFELGQTSGTFIFAFQTFSVKDQVIVKYEGEVVYDSGCVGQSGQVPVSYAGGSTKVVVQVRPNCEGTAGTAWNFGVRCPVAPRAAPIYGSDTNTQPEHMASLPGPTKFYAGKIGSGSEMRADGTHSPCFIVNDVGYDVLNPTVPINPALYCQFNHASATQAGPTRTYGYWLLRGVLDRIALPAGAPTQADRDAAVLYGRQQANAFLTQVRRYRSILQGATLFADIEGAAGWVTCDAGIPNVCPAAIELNHLVYTEFMETIVEAGYVPGLYTNVNSWIVFFDTDFVPVYTRREHAGRPIPVAVWIASCDQWCGSSRPTPAEAAAEWGDAEDAIISGGQTVVWQYYAPGAAQCSGTPIGADLDITYYDVEGLIAPRVPATLPADTTQFCTADVD
jgi:hypothetical protein